MADTPTLPNSIERKRPKSWWFMRAAVGAVMLLSIGYATLPFWLPPEWLARQLMNGLSTALNRRVHIDRVRLGWIEGVVFEGVTIEDRPGSDVPVLAKFGRIRCEFKPIASVLSGRVQELRIDDPHLFLAVDESGKLNIDDLAGQEFRGLPSRNFVIRRLMCHVRTPQGIEKVAFESLECRMDHATGILRFLGQVWTSDGQRGPAEATGGPDSPIRGGVQRRRLSIHAHVIVPRLKRGEKLTGEARIEWDGLSLGDLPLRLIPRLPFEQVEGTSTGRMTIHTQPDLGIDFGLNLALHGVTLQRGEQDRLPQLPDAEVRGEGHWDPNTDVLELKSLNYETAGVRLAGSAVGNVPVAKIDPQGEVQLELHATGAVKDWSMLYREVPRLEDRVREAGLVLAGGADFGLDLTRRRDEDHIVATIDGAQTTCSVTDGRTPLVVVVADVPKTARIDFLAGRSVPQRLQPRFEGALGGLSISGWADFVLPVSQDDTRAKCFAGIAEDLLPTVKGEIEIYSKQVEETLGFLSSSAVADHLRDCRGPVQIGLSCKPEGDDRRLELDLITQANTRISYRKVFDKPEGQALRANVRMRITPSVTGQVKDLHVATEYGRSQLIVDPGDARVEYDLGLPGHQSTSPDGGRGLKASWLLGARVSYVEDLLTLWPQWRTWCAAGQDREVTGTAAINLRGDLIWGRATEIFLAGIELVTDQMAVRWDDTLSKPAGVPMSVSASHQDCSGNGRKEQRVDIAVKGRGGTLSGSWSSKATAGGGESASPPESVEPTQYLRLRADITETAEWLEVSPSLARQVEEWSPVGALRVNADAEITGGQNAGSFSLDATDASFRIAGRRDALKAAGIPVKTTFRWEYQPSQSEHAPGVLRLTEGTATVAGLELVKTSATFDVERSGHDAKEPRAESWWTVGLAPLAFEATDLGIEGRISMDDRLRSMYAPLGQWLDRVRLEGTATWRGEMHTRPNGFAITGSLDTSDAAFSLPMANDLVPMVRKTAGSLFSVNWDAFLETGPDPHEHGLLIRDAVVKLDGNEASLAGTLTLTEAADAGSVESIETDLTCHLRLQKPKNLVSMMPESWVNDLEGKAEAWLGLISDKNGIRLGSSRVEFDELVIGTRDQPIELNGGFSTGQDGVILDQLRFEWGASRGVVSGSVRRVGDTRVGRLGLAMDHLDISDLQARLRAVSGSPSADRTRSDGNSQAIVRAVIDELRLSEVAVDTHIGVLEAVLPPKQAITADAVAAETIIRKGPVAVAFRGLADGGVITGELVADTQVSDPVYHLKYTAEDLYPGPLVDGYLRLSFPGMKATGPLTLIDETYQKLLPEVGDANYEVGSGELIIKGGTVTGRAAPRWMTRYLPGLNLSRFDFSYMHSWFRKMPSGRIHHQMIFRGPIYNLYMIGYSDPDRRFEYEVGVDFLADFDSKYWAESGQGRVPLFIKSGLVAEDGTLLDERVNFVSIERLAESIFVRNNLVVTAYHAVRKRVLGKR